MPDDSHAIVVPEFNPIPGALEILQSSMAEDPEYAWGWHCVLACCAMDEGVDHTTANRIAGRFMSTAFEFDSAGVFPDRMRWTPDPEPEFTKSFWEMLDEDLDFV